MPEQEDKTPIPIKRKRSTPSQVVAKRRTDTTPVTPTVPGSFSWESLGSVPSEKPRLDALRAGEERPLPHALGGPEETGTGTIPTTEDV